MTYSLSRGLIDRYLSRGLIEGYFSSQATYSFSDEESKALGMLKIVPREVWGEIFSYLKINELKRTNLVCKNFYKLSQSNKYYTATIRYWQCYFLSDLFQNLKIQINSKKSSNCESFLNQSFSEIIAKTFPDFKKFREDTNQILGHFISDMNSGKEKMKCELLVKEWGCFVDTLELDVKKCSSHLQLSIRRLLAEDCYEEAKKLIEHIPQEGARNDSRKEIIVVYIEKKKIDEALELISEISTLEIRLSVLIEVIKCELSTEQLKLVYPYFQNSIEGIKKSLLASDCNHLESNFLVEYYLFLNALNEKGEEKIDNLIKFLYSILSFEMRVKFFIKLDLDSISDSFKEREQLFICFKETISSIKEHKPLITPRVLQGLFNACLSFERSDEIQEILTLMKNVALDDRVLSNLVSKCLLRKKEDLAIQVVELIFEPKIKEKNLNKIDPKIL